MHFDPEKIQEFSNMVHRTIGEILAKAKAMDMEGATAFDRVSVFGSTSLAMAMVDKSAEAERWRGDALAALAELTDEDDRRVARQSWKLD